MGLILDNACGFIRLPNEKYLNAIIKPQFHRSQVTWSFTEVPFEFALSNTHNKSS